MISYQFQTLIQRIDTEFYCGSRGMVFIYFPKKTYVKKAHFLNEFIKIIYKPYHENRNKIPDRSVVLMSEIDMKSLKL